MVKGFVSNSLPELALRGNIILFLNDLCVAMLKYQACCVTILDRYTYIGLMRCRMFKLYMCRIFEN